MLFTTIKNCSVKLKIHSYNGLNIFANPKFHDLKNDEKIENR